MKRLLGALAVVLAPAGSLLAGSAGIAPSNQRIGRELDNLQIIDLSVPVQTSESASIAERMAFYKIPGVSAAVINNFAVEWAEGAGHLKAGDAASVDEEAVLQTGSVSKFVTAVLALHFVDRGMLDLDADANRALVSRKVPDTPSTTRHQVTLRHLLSHQSGIPAQPQLEDSASLLQILKGERPATNPPAVPDTIPGSRWNYSNIGYAVIQLLLEDLTGKAISQLADEIVFEPLGMSSSGFSYPLREDLRSHEAMPHATDGSPRIPEQSGRVRAPGGPLSTPRDMAKLVIAVMSASIGKDAQVISPGAARLMLAKQVDVPPEALGLPLGMGLGAFLDSSTDEVCFLHPGHNSPRTTFVFVAYPALGKGAVIGANGNLGDRLYLEILASLAIEYDWPSGQPFEP